MRRQEFAVVWRQLLTLRRGLRFKTPGTPVFAGTGVATFTGQGTFPAVFAAAGAGTLSVAGESTVEAAYAATGTGDLAVVGDMI